MVIAHEMTQLGCLAHRFELILVNSEAVQKRRRFFASISNFKSKPNEEALRSKFVQSCDQTLDLAKNIP